ncbi:MAG: TolC family protein [Planctomycetes bacterium]|nr:TolC family protein [Planctomycetota bacterium]
MNHLRWAWTPVFALLLSSCGIPQLRSADPVRELPESFNGMDSAENSSEVGFTEFFDDPILTSLVDEALQGNLNLKILHEDIEIANNEILGRSGAYLPFVTIGGGAGLDKPSAFTRAGAVDNNVPFATGQYLPTPLPDFLGAADLSWQIDIWRQLRNARDAAAFRWLGTAEGRTYVITRLTAEVAENYYTLLALDKRLENLDRTIGLMEQSLKMSISKKDAGQGTELAVQRFLAEVRKNQSEKLIINQDIIQTENRINFLLGRYPQPIDRRSENFFDLNLHALNLGVPAQLLQNRPDVRQAERELVAAGLDIKVARARFYPRLNITSGVGWEAFNTKYLLTTPESLVYYVAGDLVAPLINKRAIQADYKNANARQLQACYNYQRVVLNAFTEVINRVNMVQNYSKSIEIKKQQIDALEASVVNATKLFENAQVEYMDVLFAQRDMRDARMVLIDTKKEQLSAIVNTYQALGGGALPSITTDDLDALPAGTAVPEVAPTLPMEELPVPANP